MKKLLIGVLGVFLCIYLVSLIYIGSYTTVDTATPSDAILILGAKSQYNNKVNSCLLARVEKGVYLYKKQYAPLLIMSGGDDEYKKDNQAELMKSLAQERGVPERSILLEKNSSSTYENFLYTKKILEQKNIQSLIIVSDPYHLARAGLVAKSLGITYTLSPASQSPCWNTYKFLSFDYFRDGVALLAYLVTGKIDLLTSK